MPKSYAQLKSGSERCLYDTFECVQGIADKGPAMGAYVNGKGYDADDDWALLLLTERYGFTRVEAIKGDVMDKMSPLHLTYRCDNNAQIVASITCDIKAIRLFDEWGFAEDPTGTLGKHRPKEILLHPSLRGSEWHVIYGKTDKDYNVTWTDKQNRFPKGPIRGPVAVLFIKK